MVTCSNGIGLFREGLVLGHSKTYSRRETLDRAAQYRNKGRAKKALAEYRKVLEHEPDDHETQARIAPLLLKLGKRDEAAVSFMRAGEGLAGRGFIDKAIALMRQAADASPYTEAPWLRIGELCVEKGRKDEAVRALLEGRGRFRRAYDRPRAMALLACVLELEPLNLPVAADFAVLLRKNGQRSLGLKLLDNLAFKSGEEEVLRRVRWLQFRHFPSPRTLWRFLRWRKTAPS
jgi:tetratricopeptide (TPR) repeat protein